MFPEELPRKEAFIIGKVGKPKGIKGHFYINTFTETPENYIDTPYIYLAHKSQKIAKRYKVLEMEITISGSYLTLLENFTDRNSLEKIKGLDVLLPLEMLPEISEEDNFYLFEVIGYEVLDAIEGHIGTITNVLEIPGNPIAEVKHPEGFTFLLPLTEHFLPRINRKKKQAYTNLPNGFVDAYRKEN